MSSASAGHAIAKRRLSLFDVVCIGINAIVGSGVFAAPDDMYRAMGGYSPLGFLLCAALLLPVALCFAELAGRHDETGGAYLYARSAFGDRVGYVVGWFCYVNTFISWAANATLLMALAGVGGHPLLVKAAPALVVLALGAVNYVGVKPGALLVNAVVVGKLTAILCFVAVAAFAVSPSSFSPALPLGMAGVGQGLYIALFPLQGFEVAPVTAGETKNPRRNVPLATVASLLFAALLFSLVQVTLVGTHPDLSAVTDTPLVEGARAISPFLGLVVFVGSIVSVGGFTAGSALGSPRYAKAIADHGLLPEKLGRVHARFDTPYVAIAVTSGVTAVLATLYDYRQLVGMSNVTVIIQYVFTCLAVPVLRRKRGPSSGYRVPGGLLIPIVGALGSLALAGGSDASELVFALGALALGGLVALVSYFSNRTERG